MAMVRVNCAFVVVAMAMAMAMTSPAYGQQMPCNLKALLPCLKSVKGPYPPQPDPSCCGVVVETNPVCMCSEFVDYKDYPPSYIRNVLAIPRACGRYQLSGYRCGRQDLLFDTDEYVKFEENSDINRAGQRSLYCGGGNL